MKTALIFTSVTSFLLSVAPITVAQEYQPEGLLQPNTEGGEFQKNSVDSLGESSFGGGFDPLQLIHNHNLRRSRGGAEFAEDSEVNLNNAAEQFKKLQQQRLLEQQNSTSTEAGNEEL